MSLSGINSINRWRYELLVDVMEKIRVDAGAGDIIVCLVILMRFSVLNGGAFCIKILEN